MSSNKKYIFYNFLIVLATSFSMVVHARGWSALGAIVFVSFPTVILYIAFSISILLSKQGFTYWKWGYMYAVIAFVASFFILGDNGDNSGQYFLGTLYDPSSGHELPGYAQIIGSAAWFIVMLALLNLIITLIIQVYKNHKNA